MKLSRVMHKTLLFIMLLVFSFQAQAGDVYEQAKQALERGHVADASDLLQKKIQAEPEDYQAWFLLGVTHARAQRFHQAIEAFRHVIELRNDLAEPHNNLAVIYNELGDVKAAVIELEQSLIKHPGYAIAEENIADLHVKLALQYYKKALMKSTSPTLVRRYARLLNVRDPRAKHTDNDGAVLAKIKRDIASERKKKDIPTAVKEPEKQIEQVSEVSAPVDVQAAETVAVSETKNKLEIGVDGGVVSPATAQGQDTNTEVLDVLETWRVAWESQDLEAYFLAYADDYVPSGKHASLAAWKRYKQRVIANKSYIKVGITDIQVEFSDDDSVVSVRFNQDFRSNSYNGKNVKLLKLEKRQQGWKIVREKSFL